MSTHKITATIRVADETKKMIADQMAKRQITQAAVIGLALDHYVKYLAGEKRRNDRRREARASRSDKVAAAQVGNGSRRRTGARLVKKKAARR